MLHHRKIINAKPALIFCQYKQGKTEWKIPVHQCLLQLVIQRLGYNILTLKEKVFNHGRWKSESTVVKLSNGSKTFPAGLKKPLLQLRSVIYGCPDTITLTACVFAAGLWFHNSSG
jgi:hypothetical protein